MRFHHGASAAKRAAARQSVGATSARRLLLADTQVAAPEGPLGARGGARAGAPRSGQVGRAEPARGGRCRRDERSRLRRALGAREHRPDRRGPRGRGRRRRERAPGVGHDARRRQRGRRRRQRRGGRPPRHQGQHLDEHGRDARQRPGRRRQRLRGRRARVGLLGLGQRPRRFPRAREPHRRNHRRDGEQPDRHRGRGASGEGDARARPQRGQPRQDVRRRQRHRVRGAERRGHHQLQHRHRARFPTTRRPRPSATRWTSPRRPTRSSSSRR